MTSYTVSAWNYQNKWFSKVVYAFGIVDAAERFKQRYPSCTIDQIR